MPGYIETSIGLPPIYSIRQLDQYAANCERLLWLMVPQLSEVDSHYYFDLTTNGGETGAGTEASPYVSFASINTVLASHPSTDVVQLNVRTSPTLNYLYLDTSNRIILNALTPEVRWVPWKGQSRFSHAITYFSSGWTLAGGTRYTRAIAKPGWVSSENEGFRRPSQYKYVDSPSLCEAELHTWHHDGTLLHVNSGGNPASLNTGVRLSPANKAPLITTNVGCRRVLLQGIHGEGFGLAHGIANVNGDPTTNHDCCWYYGTHASDVTARVLLANCTSIMGGGHPLSVTGPIVGGDQPSTTGWIDCEVTPGYEVTKSSTPYNFYAGGQSEAIMLRCSAVNGPCQGYASNRPFGGHSNGGSKIGLFFLHSCANVEDTGSGRRTLNGGQPGATANDLLSTNPFRRAVVSRFTRSDTAVPALAKGGTALSPNHTYIANLIKTVQKAVDFNWGGTPTNNTSDGKSILSVYDCELIVNGLRWFGDGGTLSQEYINCLFMAKHTLNNGTISFGNGAVNATGLRFRNCVFCNVTRANMTFANINLANVFENCGFYRCDPPSNAINPVIVHNLEPFVAAFNSQLLNAGASLVAVGPVSQDRFGEHQSVTQPHLGPHGRYDGPLGLTESEIALLSRIARIV